MAVTVAEDRRPGPMDLGAVYLAPSMGVGQRMRLATIDDQLRRLPLRQSILLLSEMCFRTESLGRPPHRDQLEFASRVLPASFLPKAEGLLRRDQPPTAVLSAQVVVLLGIRLLSISDDSVGEVNDVDQLARHLGKLCLALADHVEDSAVDRESIILEFVRLGLFYTRYEHPGWLSLSGRLFFDVLPQLDHHPDWMSPLDRFEHAAGIRLDRFWAITALQGMLADQSEEHFQFPINILEHPIGPDEMGAWLTLLSQSIESAAAQARRMLISPLAGR